MTDDNDYGSEMDAYRNGWEDGKDALRESVYVVTYFGRWPDDGFELGGVYETEAGAEEAGESRECARHRWPKYAVEEREIHD